MVVGEHRIELRRAGKPVVVAHATAHGWHVPLGVRADPYPYLRRSPANHDELAVKPRYRRRWVTVADRGEAVDLLGRVA